MVAIMIQFLWLEETWGNSEEVGWARLTVLGWGISKEKLN